jgi:nitrate reductase gamma subunit
MLSHNIATTPCGRRTEFERLRAENRRMCGAGPVMHHGILGCATGHPIGILSAVDIAGVFAGRMDA